MSARSGWNAAQRAAERELKKPRKMHDPVWSDRAAANERQLAAQNEPLRTEHTCACGYHVHAPTCPTQRRQPAPFPPPPGNGRDNRPQTQPELTLAEAREAIFAGKTVRLARYNDNGARVESHVNRLWRLRDGVVEYRGLLGWRRADNQHFGPFYPKHVRYEVVEE